MPAERLSDAELERLSAQWSDRLDENLARADFSFEELIDLAERQRALAQVTDSPGHRRGLLDVAERYERAARRRSAARR